MPVYVDPLDLAYGCLWHHKRNFYLFSFPFNHALTNRQAMVKVQPRKVLKGLLLKKRLFFHHHNIVFTKLSLTKTICHKT